MFDEMKNSLYKTRNISYPPARPTIDDIHIEGIWSKTLNSEYLVFHIPKHLAFGTLKSLKAIPPQKKSVFVKKLEIEINAWKDSASFALSETLWFFIERPFFDEIFSRFLSSSAIFFWKKNVFRFSQESLGKYI